jgi:hypothetical protein
MRSSKYDAARLAPIVASSHSLSDVIRKLGLQTTGGNHRLISMRVRLAGLDTSHFLRRKVKAQIDGVPAERLTTLVRDSRSIAQILAALGLPTVGRPHHELKRRLRDGDFDTSHFRGAGWARGETKQTNPGLARGALLRKRPDAEVFVENSPESSGTRIARRLLALGWRYACAICGIAEWRSEPLALHLDHINGVNNDNRFRNLRLLCPNCHSQTPTYCNKAREGELIWCDAVVL